ncbi:MAG: thioredoxin domain-containing protein [Chlorobium sp.]
MNRLANEKSPYLLQHSSNPVEWFAWGEEAFAQAAAADLPIFLSVGYATCHWCHVMERESFENEEIAALLNRHFIAIKVDREELPDLDRLYMNYVQSTTGSGGWPMSVWLTPDRKPFYGGTYFPSHDRYGITGFTTILNSIAHLWHNDREKIINAYRGFIHVVDELSQLRPTAMPADDEAQQRCFEWLTATYDSHYGGFGGAPKFPRPVLLNFLFNHAYYTGNTQGRAMALHTLRQMANGGIHDHLGVVGKGGGGFARYATDERWHVPHFEKMLYDNAQLAISNLEAFQCSSDALYKRVAEDIFNYVLSDMTSPEGGFYSAEDADSLDAASDEKKEGAFYLWSAEEMRYALGDARLAAIFSFIHGVTEEGNVQHDPHGEFIGKNILMQQASVEEAAVHFGVTVAEITAALDEARTRLYDVRSRRASPFLDDKILTAWNGLMISAFARGYRVLHHASYLSAAKKAALFILEKLNDPEQGRLLRRYRDGNAAIVGKAEDYAFFVQALLDLYEASFDVAYLQKAIQLMELQNRLFYDNMQGGYFSTAFDDNTVPMRLKESYDGAEPSANSVSVLNLLRLAEITGNEEFARQAEESMACFAAILVESPQALPQLLVALNVASKRRCRITFAGELHTPSMAALRALVDARYLPDTISIHASTALTLLQHTPAIPGPEVVHPQAMLCINNTCQLPVQEPARLAEMLDKMQQQLSPNMA